MSPGFNLIEEDARRQKLLALREKGINPYPNRVQRTNTIADVLNTLMSGREKKETLSTGRMRLMREWARLLLRRLKMAQGVYKFTSYQ